MWTTTDDDGACLYYKLTIEPKGSGELKMHPDNMTGHTPRTRTHIVKTCITVSLYNRYSKMVFLHPLKKHICSVEYFDELVL